MASPPATPAPPPGPVRVALVGEGAVQDPAGTASPDWTALTAQGLRAAGREVLTSVATDDGAGYVARGASGQVFSELVVRAVTPGTGLVVLVGRRSDLPEVTEVANAARVSFAAVHQAAPGAALVVVAPPPVAGRPAPALSRDRDALRGAAAAAGPPSSTRWPRAGRCRPARAPRRPLQGSGAAADGPA